MGTRVNVMDVEVDLLTEETFCSELTEYLENDYLNVMHLISLEYLDIYDENEIVKETLEQADLVLPGDKTILSSHHVDVLETGGMIVDYQRVKEALKNVDLKGKTFYLVVRNKKEAKVIYGYMSRHFGKEQILGVYADDGEITEEALINDINTTLPDMVLVSMDSTRQEEWLLNNKQKMSAKLCVVLGSIAPLILRENIHVPEFFKKIHLDKLIQKIARIPNSHSTRKRIFNRKMDQYNTKKKFWG